MVSYVRRHAPFAPQPPRLALPTTAALQRAARRPRASAPGPDRLPYRAWLAATNALDTLHDVMRHMLEMRVAPE
eukprot:1910869-Pyramimonas_sp.AAC.1